MYYFLIFNFIICILLTLNFTNNHTRITTIFFIAFYTGLCDYGRVWTLENTRATIYMVINYDYPFSI